MPLQIIDDDLPKLFRETEGGSNGKILSQIRWLVLNDIIVLEENILFVVYLEHACMNDLIAYSLSFYIIIGVHIIQN